VEEPPNQVRVLGVFCDLFEAFGPALSLDPDQNAPVLEARARQLVIRGHIGRRQLEIHKHTLHGSF